jgi:dihydrofolate reductase
MPSLIYSVAASLDGYIADPDGGFDWIVADPDIDFAALFARDGTAVMGGKSWEVARAMGGGPAAAMQIVVASRTLRAEDCPGATVTADPVAAVAGLKAARGKDLWLFGGGELFQTLLAAGLVDGVEVAVIPVLLGKGIPMLPPGDARARLKLVRHRLYEKSGIVLLTYDVTREAHDA